MEFLWKFLHNLQEKKVCLRLEVVFVFMETELMCKIFDINGFSE